jgi:hypothetical protein
LASELDPLKHRPIRAAHVPTPIQETFYGPPAITFPQHNEAKLQELRDIAAKAEQVSTSQYIIWNPGSALPPRVVQNSRPEAIKVAGRMANENPGSTFYVCKLVHKAEKPIAPAVTYTDLEKA